MTKKTCLILVGLLLSLKILTAQEQNIVLNTPITGNQEYIATENISVEQGFDFDPYSGKLIGRIDPFIVTPPEGGGTGGPNPGDDGVVGIIPANASVSSTGAATYTVPINLPKGIADLTPVLSLSYNSSSDNGSMGTGWIVNGLSVISRTKTTLYHDGYIDGVDFDGNDKYLLDGQRLIAINDGGYGDDNTEYRTENEIFAKVLSFNSDNSTDPDYFKVFAKNGLVYEYGKTASTRVEGSDCAPNFMFCYNNKISDRNGNYIEYTYNNENGLGLIKEINYSNIKVVFNYIE
ncbi:MAG: SpvB/TcaC N-terminal domain-containing protein, partial [Bacteroidota bacterium]|nr:SpvB/TcaC N-terminal domain-containing protein [Bacteroidota bacterium]